MKYFNDDTIKHFQFESNYVSKKEIQKQVNEFVEIDCEYNSNEDKQMLIDRETVNQKELLENINCPILIIQGTEDISIPLEDSKRAIALLPKDSHLKLVEGADHDFTEYIDVLVQISNDWFIKHLER